MGQCAVGGREACHASHQSPEGVSLILQPIQAVCIAKVRSMSSNAAAVLSRYHDSSKESRCLADDYIIDNQILGHGLGGDVVLARGRIDQRRYALKKIKKTEVEPYKLQRLSSEVEIYLTLDHPNIARLRDVYETPSDVCLLVECCEGGEMYFRLQKRGVYNDTEAAEASRQMLRAIGYLHSRNVVHRDLKLENFLYEKNTDDSQVKLIDFGFARLWDPSSLMMSSCGSIAYLSPDVLTGNGYTNKCDMWSVGVIMWMLLVGYPPFHGDQKIMVSKIKVGKADWSHSARWRSVSRDAVDLVKKLMHKDPTKRLDAQQALRHPWLHTAAAGPAKLSRGSLRSLQSYAAGSKLRRAVLQLLAQELTAEETNELRDTFLALDQDHDGTICLKDLKEAIRNADPQSPIRRRCFREADASPDNRPVFDWSSAAPPTMSDPASPCAQLCRANSEAIGDLFAMLDANGDDRIYYSDFLAGTMEARTTLRTEAMRATFSRFDADGSGTISVDDFRQVLGDTFEGVNIDRLVAEANPDHHGEITYSSFLSVLEAADAVPHSSPTGGRSLGCQVPYGGC